MSAVGSFEDTHSNGQSFVANEVNGKWMRAREVTLPSNAGSSVQNSEIHSVVCWSRGNCSAIGSYLDNTNRPATPRASRSTRYAVRGSRLVRPYFPPASTSIPTSYINQVACTHAGNCAAVGSYISKDNATEGLILDEVRGVWKSADHRGPSR